VVLLFPTQQIQKMRNFTSSAKKFKRGVLGLTLILILGLLTILFPSPLYQRDIGTLGIVLILLAFWGFYFWISKSINKIIFGSLFAFTFFHLVLFPMIYLLLLKYNPKSLEFEGYAFRQGKQSAIENLNMLYDIKDLNSKKKFADEAIASKDSFFYLPLNRLILKEYKHGEYTYALKMKSPESAQRPLRVESLVISFKDTEVAVLYNQPITPINENYTVLDYFIRHIDGINKNIKIYNDELNLIKKDHHWAYTTIIPYTLNITLGGNVKCQSPLANVAYFFHYVTVWIFIIGFLSSSIYSVISSAKKEEYNEYSN